MLCIVSSTTRGLFLLLFSSISLRNSCPTAGVRVIPAIKPTWFLVFSCVLWRLLVAVACCQLSDVRIDASSVRM